MDVQDGRAGPSPSGPTWCRAQSVKTLCLCHGPHRHAGRRGARRLGRAGDAHPRTLVAANAIELAAARGVLSRAAMLIDAHHLSHPASDGSAEELGALFAEAQAAKAFVNEAAATVVDRALALSGGAGYVNGSLLARAYRDVRAGSFMHPLGANRAYDYLGRVALGEPVALH
ncbi:MAG TPA: acyl-CoA dehydrogenase family protein [Solirubrobacteraceae bacterium]|nr:acyl-CoA dehydrogenase family protein [Solirubrobacteraceae bacterium]